VKFERRGKPTPGVAAPSDAKSEFQIKPREATGQRTTRFWQTVAERRRLLSWRQHKTPEDSNFRTHHRENLKSYNTLHSALQIRRRTSRRLSSPCQGKPREATHHCENRRLSSRRRHKVPHLANRSPEM
jgi:hypothetical protein